MSEEGGRAAFSWTEGEDVTEKATQYCKENTKEELWERCISAVKQQVAASLMEAELPAFDLEVQVAEDKTAATFSHAEGGDLRLEAHTFCSEYVAEDKVPVCAHHLVQGAVQKAQQLAAAEEGGAAAAHASRAQGAGGAAAGGAQGAAAACAAQRPARRRAREARHSARRPRRQSRPSPRAKATQTQRTPSDWARLVGPRSSRGRSFDEHPIL